MLNKTGELWGIDTVLLDNTKKVIPSVSFERTFTYTLANYLKFASETLHLALPLKIIAGATDVESYRMGAEGNWTFGGFEKIVGRAFNEKIIYEGLITDYTAKASAVLRPFFEHVWEECGLERPDKEEL